MSEVAQTVDIPQFLQKEEKTLSEIQFENMNKVDMDKAKEILSNLSKEEQKIAIRYISDTVICNELQRRLLGRKFALDTVNSVAENVKLTDL